MTPSEADLPGRLQAEAARLGVPLIDESVDRLIAYVRRLQRWNERTNLVARADTETLLVKHIADALAIVEPSRPSTDIVDLGSGAGLPGLVLAIVRPEARVTLVDSNGKKISFLTDVVHHLQLENVSIVESRIEALAERSEHQARHDLVVARALATVPKLLAWARPLLREHGRFIAMKGPGFESELQGIDPRVLGYSGSTKLEYDLADGARRILLTYST